MKTTLFFAAITVVSMPAEATVTYKGELQAGAQYDSNVAVSELDRASNQSDHAGYLKGKFSVDWQATDVLSFNTGLSHQRTHYKNAKNFNLATTTWNVGAGVTTSLGKWGVHSYFADAALDGNAFMRYQQSGLSWQNSITAKTYLHISADYLRKRFDTVPERDANGGQLSTQWFYMPDLDGQMINLGYTFQYEDAYIDRLDFTGHASQVSWTYPTYWWGSTMSLKVHYQFAFRDYREADAFLSVTQRTDRQHTLGVTASYQFSRHVAFDIGARYADFQSNLSIADYHENKANVGVTATF